MLLQEKAITSVRAQHALHTDTAILASSRLIELDEGLNWKFRTASGPITLTSQQVVHWGAWNGVTRNSAIWLSDGSWLVGDLQFTTPEAATVTSEWFQPVTIPIRSIRGLVRVAPASIAAWNRLQRQLEMTSGGRDAVWLSGGRQISGILRLESSTSEAITSLSIENAGQTIQVAWSDVQAIVFSPALLGAIPTLSNELVMGLVDGSRLNVRSLSNATARAKLSLVCGIELLSLDVRVEFSAGVNMLSNRSPRATFLADLEPANYRNISHTRIEWPLGKNRDLQGRPLMTVDGIMDRGLSMHSSSQAAYRWDGSPARLLAEVTLAKPPEVSDYDVGSVECQVVLARNGKLETVKSISISRSANAPQLLDIDLTGAQLFALVTEQGALGPYGDHLLWLEARIAK